MIKSRLVHGHRARSFVVFLIIFTSILSFGMISSRVQNFTTPGNTTTTAFVQAKPRPATMQGNSDPTGDEWPMFGGQLNHSGVARTMPMKGSGSLWSTALGNYVTTSPAVVGDRLFIGCSDGKIYCLNATTGTINWTYTAGSNVASSAAVVGGFVYEGSYNNKVYRLNATKGTINWTHTIGNNVTSSPAVSGNRVYMGCMDDKLYCLNATTGAYNWSFPTNGPVYSSPAVVGGRVYVGSDDHDVYCLNATNGSKIWSYTTKGNVESSPAIMRDRVFIGSFDGNVYCLNATNGSKIWNYTTDNYVVSSPAILKDQVFVGSLDSNVYCLNATNGSKIWFYKTGSYVLSSPAIVKDQVFIGGLDSNVYCLNATNGSKIWSYTTGGSVFSPLAITNGRVYVGDNDHKVYCLPMDLVPSPPRNLNASAGNGNITLSWQAPANNWGSAITNYTIYRGMTSGSETIIITIGNVTKYTDTGLTNGQIYYYKISAVSRVGAGAQSNETNSMPLGPPTALQSLTATSGAGKVILNWLSPKSNGGSAITNYTVYKGMTSGNETLLMTLGPVLNYTDFAVTNGTTYYYKVAAKNVLGIGPNATEVSAIPGNVPSEPLFFTATAGTAHVILNWSKPASNGWKAITHYLVYRGTIMGGETLLKMLGPVLNYTDSTVIGGTTYYYKVQAQNSIGLGANSTEASATPVSVPGAPQTITATGGTNQVVLIWSPPDSNGGTAIMYYLVYRGITTGSEAFYANVGNVTTYTDTNVTDGQAYYYKVSAVNSAGEGAMSIEVTATPTTGGSSGSPSSSSMPGYPIGLTIGTVAITCLVLVAKKHRNFKS